MSGDLPIDDEDGEDDGSGSGSGDYASNDFTDKDEILRKFLNFSRTTVSKEMVQPQPTADSPDNPPTTAAASQDPTKEKDTKTTPSTFPDGDKKDEVAGIDLTSDHIIPSTTLSSTIMPLGETPATKSGIDISVTKDTNKDNSVDRLDVSTPKDSGDEVQIEEVENDVSVKVVPGSRMYDMESPEDVTSENVWERTEVLAAVIACGVVGLLCAIFLLLLLTYRMKKKDEGSYDLGDIKLSSTTYHKAPTKEFYA
ncbi:syndecan-2-like isoform X2 [Enoplosus armatus]